MINLKKVKPKILELYIIKKVYKKTNTYHIDLAYKQKKLLIRILTNK